MTPSEPKVVLTDEDFDGFIEDTIEVYPKMVEDATIYAGGYEDPDEARVTYIAVAVSNEWDLWNGFTNHSDAPEPYIEMLLDDQLVAAVRRYLDRQ